MKFDFVMDSREKAKPKKRAIRKYKETVIESLPSGDYACRQQGRIKILLERKSLEDFTNSIHKKRIFKQAEKLHKDCNVVVLILEGDYKFLPLKLKKLKLNFNSEAFWGTYCSLVVRDNFHVVWTSNQTETQDVAYKICRKMAEGKYQTKRRWRPKSLNTPVELLEQIPGVTEMIAKRLIKKYSGILSIALQEEKELCSVDGIGPRLAKRILKELT